MNENNILKFLVTDFYAPFDLNWFKLILPIIPKKILSILAKRYKTGLKSERVIICYKALFYSLIFLMTKDIKYSLLKDEKLGAKANKIAKKFNTSILSMNTYANYAFKDINNSKILFQFHPHPNLVKSVLMDEIKLNNSNSSSLLKEYEFSLSKKELRILSNEIWLADKILCASSVTKDSLIKEGFNINNIKVIPYGVDTSKFIYKRKDYLSGKFRVIFIGSLNQRKGVSYLLKALSKLTNVELIIVGRGIFDLKLIENYNFDIKIYRDVPFKKLLNLMHSSHCFVLPSIIEGFGQVIIEAMATGLPVIVSENTIGRDIIIDGKNGFLVPIRNVNAIEEALLMLQQNTDLINEIGYNGHLFAKSLTWEKFRNNISNVLSSC